MSEFHPSWIAGGDVALGIAMQIAAVYGLTAFEVPDCEHEYICRFCGRPESE